MGNAVQKSSARGVFLDFEHIGAKRLLAAIVDDDGKAVQDAINFAKHEFTKPVESNANRAVYDDMVEQMIQYLTREYDIGDGIIFKQSPLTFCDTRKSERAKQVILSNLTALQNTGSTVTHAVSHSVGEITKERVDEAKERLKALRNAKK